MDTFIVAPLNGLFSILGTKNSQISVEFLRPLQLCAELGRTVLLYIE